MSSQKVKWYVEEIFTPDDTDIDRARRYGEFEADKKTPVRVLALAGMKAIGWQEPTAESYLRAEADLEGTTIEDGAFDFTIFGGNGEYQFVFQQTPHTKPSVWVVVVNNQPVAVRPWKPSPVELQRIADRHRLPVEAFLPIEVTDVVDPMS